ncbi:MAG: hypothetical protein PWQ67_1937 [Clostridia bacterium]|jgi:hypothetical protein|nr:hypothetical protein [Clostridia bacterium]MDN5323483.1 hypothetical protein [Clostridia bacterium]
MVYLFYKLTPIIILLLPAYYQYTKNIHKLIAGVMNMTNNQLKNCGWPFYKITPSAIKQKDKELLLIAECVPSFYTNFYYDFIKEKNSDLVCPKLDNNSECIVKLANIIKEHHLDKIITVRVEKHCCGYLTKLVKEALKFLNQDIPIVEKVVDQKGTLLK